ncbi:hypothetical protein VMCG_02842 [Cytospora schulzeri]|uniref:Uncharacterized protein n=1 Tax=Cytospora schulzeri TaxID=448051 RepID=A0A423WZH6_9PEZI|nr:hypothetical protein VMCG_02842 [Valsa malicola]
MEPQNRPQNRTLLRGTVSCQTCKRRHLGPCRFANNNRRRIRGIRQTDGHDVLFPLRLVATKVRQYGGPDRLDTFVREHGSEDAVMCYCDGTKPFCLKHYAEHFAEETRSSTVIFTQADEDGLRQAMWSNFNCHAFDDFDISPSKANSLTGDLDDTFNPFRRRPSPNQDVEMVTGDVDGTFNPFRLKSSPDEDVEMEMY